MKEWNSMDDIIDFAIGEEIAASNFYTELAANADRPAMRRVFEGFAREEQGHRDKLMAVKQGAAFESRSETVTDLKIGDYLVDVTPSPGMSYQDALIVAMKKEKAAFRLYTALAEQAPADDIRELFLGLAQEEAKHKLRFETEYDEMMKEN